MARIVLSALIQDIRGSITGSTFSAWKGKNYIKNKAVTISNPQTLKQMAIRDNFAMSVTDWRLLTPTQQAQWEEYAQSMRMQNSKNNVVGPGGIIPELGQTKSGFNAYIGVNQNLKGAELIRVSVPPVIPEPLAPVVTTTTYTGWILHIEFQSTLHLRVGTHKLELWLTGDWKGAHPYIAKVVDVPEPPAIPPAIDLGTIRMGSGTNIREVPFSTAKGGEPVPIVWQLVIVRYDGYRSPVSELYTVKITL